jgi:DNA processing protein
MRALALTDGELLALASASRRGALAEQYASFDERGWRERCRQAGLELVCRHEAGYPAGCRDLASAPAALHAAGGLERMSAALSQPTVAIVGSRGPSDYGRDVAHALARGLAAAGVTVVSGLAYGIDAAAHAGAIAGRGATIAVLAGGAEVAYPARHRALYEQVLGSGGTISEMPAGSRAFRWCFLARNRVIAALAGAVIVVEARTSSGSLLTARLARELGRPVGAVPGRVTASLAAGPLQMLRTGARVVRDAHDALELVCGPGLHGAPGLAADARTTGVEASRAPPPTDLDAELRALLESISDGEDTPERLVTAGHEAEEVSRGLGELELLGYVRRSLDGSYVVVP